MIRVHVICEGQTEEIFVDQVLAETFIPRGICLIPARIGKPGHKGGNLKFERLLTDVRARLLGDKTAYCTTLFDFYGLPEDFPGKAQAKAMAGIASKAECVVAALKARLQAALGEEPLRRFIPYVQMYEFEGLLFSNPEGLAQGINQSELIEPLQRIRAAYASPEEINNSPDTAPSKRILKLYPAYEKPLHGSIAAIEIGLNVIRQECPQFNAWLQQLEALQPQEPECA